MRILASMEEEFPDVSIAEGGSLSDGPTMMPSTSGGPPSLSMPPLEPHQITEFVATVGVTASPETDGEAPESTAPMIVYGDIVPVDQLPEPVVVERMEP